MRPGLRLLFGIRLLLKRTKAAPCYRQVMCAGFCKGSRR